MQRLVVVGASLAGLRTAQVARQHGYDGEIVMVGDEVHLPYDRPPLCKEVVNGSWTTDRVFRTTPGEVDELRIDLRTATAAMSLDTGAREVTLSDASVLGYDRLVIATGVRARELPGPRRANVHTMRTLEDAVAIRDALLVAQHVVIVGSGFIGSEIASAAIDLDCKVTVVEAMAAPLVRVLPAELAAACTALHRRRGVEVLFGAEVASIGAGSSGERVVLADGREIPADVVVVGIGTVPNTQWLAGSGLDAGNGVRCGSSGMATDAGDVFAVGDVASWFYPALGEHRRIEHWTHALEQAATVGRQLAGVGEPPASPPVPYFWSEQHAVKIQMAGLVDPSHQFELVTGDLDSSRFLAAFTQGDRFTGVLGFNVPRLVAASRRLLDTGLSAPAALQMLTKMAS